MGHLRVWSLIRVLAGLQFGCWWAAEGKPAVSARLESTKAVQSLSPVEAAQEPTVSLRGVVTVSQELWRVLFVQDDTGGIYCDTRNLTEFPTLGDLIEIDGYASEGGFLPTVVIKSFRSLGPAKFPAAAPASSAELWRGERDGDLVLVRGYVMRAVHERAPFPHWVVTLLQDGREMEATVVDVPSPLFEVGSEVEIAGAFGPLVDRERQIRRVMLMTAQPGMVRLLKDPSRVAQETPQQDLAELFARSDFRRKELVRLNGVVHFTSTNDLFLADGSNGVSLVNLTDRRLDSGNAVALVGFPNWDRESRSVEVVWFEDRGLRRPSLPIRLTHDELFGGRRCGQWVEAEGDFLHRFPRPNGEVLVLGSSDRTFEVFLSSTKPLDWHAVRIGTRLRARGVLLQAPTGEKPDDAPRLVLAAASGIEIIAPPPWPWVRTVQVITALLICASIGISGFALAHRRLQASRRRAQAVDDQLRRLNTELEDRIRSRTAQLEATNARLIEEVVERREAELALAEEASKRKALLNSSRDGIVVLTEDGKVHEANERFAVMLGYAIEEVYGLYIWDWDAKLSRDLLLGMLRQVNEAGRCFESVHQRKNGDRLQVEVTTSVAWWRSKRYIVCICRDIQDRKRAEIMRRDQTKVLEMIAQGADLSRTLDCLIGALETQCESMIGSVLLAVEDGKHLRHEAGSRLPESYRKGLGLVPIAEGTGSCGTAAFRKEPFIVEDIGSHPFWKAFLPLTEPVGLRCCWSIPILDESHEILGTFAIYGLTPAAPKPEHLQLMEMAAHTAAICIRCARATEALSRSEKRFKFAMQGANDGLWDWDLTTNEAYLSPRWKSMLGYEDHELPNHLDTWKQLVDEDDRAATLQLATDVIQGRGEKYEVEFRMRHKEGHWVDILARAFLVRNADGKPERLVGTHTDITQRKEAEKCRMRLEGQLRQSHKMEAIGTLAGGIAHDFNNILGAIIAHAELIRLEPHQTSNTLESLNDLLKAGHRAKELIKQILTFSRQQEPNRKLMDIEPVLRESLSLLRAALPAQVELCVRVNDPVPKIMADATLIQQVIMNLATNAAQAVVNQVGRLDIEVGPCEVDRLTAQRHPALKEGGYVRLRVRDDGPGMPPEILERIFEPFFTTKAPGQGTGLGLSVVHGIVQEHEGAILVESQPGVGTCFDVFLPAAVGEVVPEVIAKPDPVAAGGREHVLLVDDEPSLLRVGEKILRHRGYQVTSCASPDLAYELFRQSPSSYDLVVTDYSMPTESGVDLALRMLAVRPETPILICTGYGAGLSRDQLLRAGIRGLLQKPVALDELCQAVRMTLDTSPVRLAPMEVPLLKCS